jgi:hypothetical protein
MIEQYFEKYPTCVISFNYVQNVKTIHFWLNNHWEVPAGVVPQTMGVKEDHAAVDKMNKNRHYCILYIMKAEPTDDNQMVTYKEPTYAEMFEVLSAIFEYNIEKEKKEELLKAKIAELQSKFTELPLDKLEKMDFK